MACRNLFPRATGMRLRLTAGRPQGTRLRSADAEDTRNKEHRQEQSCDEAACL